MKQKMVRRTFNQGTLFDTSRRSLRSDKTNSMDMPQVNTTSSSWKSVLTPSKTSSVSSFSNGHQLRSTKSLQEKCKSSQKDSLEVHCNGLGSSHCYGTRFGGKTVEPKPQPLRRNSHWDEPASGRNRLPRHRSVSASFSSPSELFDHLLPAEGDGHQLRSRQIYPLNSYNADLYVEEETQNRCHVKQHSADSLVTHSVSGGKVECSAVNSKGEKRNRSLDSSHCRGRSQSARRKRLTAEQKLIEDNKAYYKLEVKNNKLRSSGYYIHQREANVALVKEEPKTNELKVPKDTGVGCNGSQSELGDFKKTVVKEESEIKRNKIRLSEVSLLNNEAENFMFGETTRKDDSDDLSDESDGGSAVHSDGSQAKREVRISRVGRKVKNNKELDYSVAEQNDRCNEKISVKKLKSQCLSPLHQETGPLGLLHCDENSVGSCSLDSNYNGNCIDNCSRRKRRRTHAEVLINDNIDYYKFELPGSRLRYQGSILPQTSLAMKNGSDSGGVCKQDDIKTDCVRYSCAYQKDMEVSCSCENDIRKPTSNVTKPGHSSGTMDFCGNSESESGLHFSFEAVPLNEPWYQTYHRQDEGEEFYLTNINDCTYWKPFLLPYEMPSQKMSSGITGSSVLRSTGQGPMKRRKRKQRTNLLDRKPRKSPRCHASTLAILSSLMQRRRKELERAKEEEEEDEDDRADVLKDDDSRDGTEKSRPCSSDSAKKEVSIDQLLGFNSEISASSDSHSLLVCETPDDNNSGRSSKLKIHKAKRLHKPGTNTRRSDAENVAGRDIDTTDIDPVVFEEMATGAGNPIDIAVDPAIRCRGGPCMDVISLLDSSTSCCCMGDIFAGNRGGAYADRELSYSGKELCNGSESASSTCEDLIQSSDIGGGLRRIRGKKRKRKKNLTGWPVEKQKLKRRLMLKLSRPEMNLRGQHMNVKCNNADDKHQRTVSDAIVSVEGTGKSDCKEGMCVDGNIENEPNVNNSTAKDSSTASSNAVDTLKSNILDTSANAYEKKISTEEPREFVVVESAKAAEKISLPRTISVDSSSQHSDFQPRVRVKKIKNISEFVLKNSLTCGSTSVNTRRLRSAASTSFPSGTVVPKKQFYGNSDKGDTSPMRKTPGRKKKLKGGTKWDSWSTRRRR